jgi:hypothetical protein
MRPCAKEEVEILEPDEPAEAVLVGVHAELDDLVLRTEHRALQQSGQGKCSVPTICLTTWGYTKLKRVQVKLDQGAVAGSMKASVKGRGPTDGADLRAPGLFGMVRNFLKAKLNEYLSGGALVARPKQEIEIVVGPQRGDGVDGA